MRRLPGVELLGLSLRERFQPGQRKYQDLFFSDFKKNITGVVVYEA